MRILGLDPGLQRTGWGIVDYSGNRMKHVADGVVSSTQSNDLAQRLVQLHQGLSEIIDRYKPESAAVEETFVNKNPNSTLKLGMARGVVLLVPAQFGLQVYEYPPNRIKKTVVGVGHAAKEQIQMMVGMLLPGSRTHLADAADALAVAICHAHNMPSLSMTIHSEL